MKRIAIALGGLVAAAPLSEPVSAYTHANRWGGATTHTAGYTSASGQYGRTVTHTAGQGTSATNAWGGSAYHAAGSDQTTFHSAYGGTATHTYGVGTSATTAARIEFASDMDLTPC